MIGKPDLTPTPLDRITRITTVLGGRPIVRRAYRLGYWDRHWVTAC
jgi:hypothetical protein